jgi:hypothetical protein
MKPITADPYFQKPGTNESTPDIGRESGFGGDRGHQGLVISGLEKWNHQSYPSAPMRLDQELPSVGVH